MMNPSERMYIEDVSRYIGIGKNTIQRRDWRHKNKFPMGKIGQDLVSYRPMVDKWLEERCDGKH